MPDKNMPDAARQGGRPEVSIVTARILEVLAAEEVRRVIDIGCGRGDLAAALVRRGYSVTGIDPQEVALASARARAPGADFIACEARAIPARDGSFGAAVFVNSLHHLPGPDMLPGLAEAWRLLRPGGVLLVIEPLATGSFFNAMRRIDDETAVRAEALDALAEFTSRQGVETVLDERIDRVSRFESVESFVTFLCVADPERRKVVDAEPEAVAADFLRHVEDGEAPEPYVLVQPHLVRVLRKSV